jgi:hypothetical protein
MPSPMDSTQTRLLAVVIALLLTVGFVVVADRNKSAPKASATPTAGPTVIGTLGPGRCQQLPGKAPVPEWYPSDLKLPAGSYPADIKLPTTSGYPRAIFAVKGTLRDFVIHALGEWPKAGWVLGRGEAEAGEAEDNFYRPGSPIRGAFIARTDFCDAGWTWVYIVMGQARAPRPSGRPMPSPTGSGPLQ